MGASDATADGSTGGPSTGVGRDHVEPGEFGPQGRTYDPGPSRGGLRGLGADVRYSGGTGHDHGLDSLTISALTVASMVFWDDPNAIDRLTCLVPPSSLNSRSPRTVMNMPV